jgi:hypothetical protein
MTNSVPDEVIGRLQGFPDLGPAIAELLLGTDGAKAKSLLRTEAGNLKNRYRPILEKGPRQRGCSPVDALRLASCDVLANEPVARDLKLAATGFTSDSAAHYWMGVSKQQSNTALAAIFWLANDIAECSRCLIRAHPDDLLDEILVAVLKAILLRNGEGTIRLLLEYAEKYEDEGWSQSVAGLVHLPLLAVLQGGVERGILNATDLPGNLSSLPLWYLSYLPRD